MVESEETVEEERQRVFLDEKVSSFRAEISVYRETFKVIISSSVHSLLLLCAFSVTAVCFTAGVDQRAPGEAHLPP